MFRKPISFLLVFVVSLLLLGGTTVKRGPASPTQVYLASFYATEADPSAAPRDCFNSGGHSSGAMTVCTNEGSVTHPVYLTGQGYTKTRIHRLRCFYEDGQSIGGAVDNGDEMTVCVGKFEDGSSTTTTSCLTWDSYSDVLNTTYTDAYETPVDIADTEFGLILYVSAVTDAASSFAGTCTVEYSGAN